MVHSVNSRWVFSKDQWFFIISNTLKGFLSKPLELSVYIKPEVKKKNDITAMNTVLNKACIG